MANATNGSNVVSTQITRKGATPDFNNCGVLKRKPDGEFSFRSKNRMARATIMWAKIGNNYATEYIFRFMTGRFHASRVKITVTSKTFKTLDEAIIYAAQRLEEDVTANYHSVPPEVKIPVAHQKAFAELTAWLEETIANPPQPPEPPKPLANFKFGDFFCGIGGFHRGLAQQGAKCVVAAEWDKFAQKTYLANHTIDGVMHGDVTKIDPHMLPDMDGVCAGFPCQPFSIAGKKQGFKDEKGRGSLFFNLLRIIEVKQPKIVLLENVPNLATIDDGKTCDRVMDELANLGYMVSMQMMVASEFGVPQQRKRLFFVGIRHDIYHRHGKPYVFPKGATPSKVVADILEPNVTKAVNGVMVPKKNPSTDMTKTRLLGHINGVDSQGNRIFSIFGQGATLCANSGGAAGKSSIYDVNGLLRGLISRECARLSGWDDSFKIVCSETQAKKQFGNSVVVPVVSAIAETFGAYLK